MLDARARRRRLLTALLAVVFRREIRQLAQRVRSAAGVDFADTTSLQREVDLPPPPVEAALPLLPPKPTHAPDAARASEAAVGVDGQDSVETTEAVPQAEAEKFPPGKKRPPIVVRWRKLPAETVLDELLRDTQLPELRVVALAARIERAARGVVAASGAYPTSGTPSLARLLDLAKVPDEVRSRALAFNQVRSQVVHGRRIAADQVNQTIESGIELLEFFEKHPTQPPFVVATNITPYSDAFVQKPVGSFQILLLKQSGGDVQAFPTTRTFYEPGMRVAWEWNMALTLGAAWYRDPETQVIRVAWSESAEFVGRPVDTL